MCKNNLLKIFKYPKDALHTTVNEVCILGYILAKKKKKLHKPIGLKGPYKNG